MNKKKALVLGGSGFLGSFVADQLSEMNFETYIFDKVPSPYLLPHQQMILGDILNQKHVDKAIEGKDIVYNFAGQADLNASLSAPLKTIELNVLGNTYVLEACVKHQIERFVYASTVYVFSSKGSFYGVSKKCSEKIIEEYAREFSLPYTIIRYGSVYGNRADQQNRLYRIIREALTTGKVSFQGTGLEEREYIHVKDAARLSVEILSPEFQNEHVVLTGIERFRYSDLLKMLSEILNDQISIEYRRQDYKGHYTFTPYSFDPRPGKKIACNPFIDFGQGLLDSIQEVYQELKEDQVPTILDVPSIGRQTFELFTPEEKFP